MPVGGGGLAGQILTKASADPNNNSAAFIKDDITHIGGG